MATKKDLVEAYSFSRRRLVTAFISGAPGGREVEPSRPGRTIVGGLALAVLLIAGAAVTGVFKPRVDGDWTEPGLVTSKETASDYLILDTADGEDPELRPLINITSAMLLFGADVEATQVPEDELKTLEQGAPIGILNAPGSPPDADDLVNEGWTACTDGRRGIKVNVSETAATEPAPGTGFLVKSEGDFYVIGEGAPEDVADPRAYRFPVQVSGKRRLSDTTLGDLSGSISSQAVEVPGDWMRLFPPGGALDVDSMGLGGRIGEPVDYAGSGGIPGRARVGDFYVLGDATYAIGAHAPIKLTPFAAVLLRASVGDDRELEPTGVVELDLGDGLFEEAHWPVEPLTQPAGELCAELAPDAASPGVRLVERPDEAASADAADVPADEIEISVDSGAGAYVRSGQWDNETGDGEAFLIDSRGNSYLLQGPDVPGLLGYDDVDVLVAPDEWVDLFHEGVTLSVAAARCPPATEGREPCA
ncbi:MAG: type VII secretion protein EccB [Actinomycetota bacterium]|nr:type VII secretion protein EccB [Actinomycetota bacterium]